MKNDVVFVLLAGGKSQRMGVAKGLLKFEKSYWILEQLKRIADSNIKTVLIGLGYNCTQYFDAIPWFKKAIATHYEYLGLKIRVCVNLNPEFGKFSTLLTAVQSLNKKADIIINPIDVPILNKSDINKIASIKNTLIKPSFEGKTGHPIKISAAYASYLKSIDFTKNIRLDLELKKIDTANISIIEVKDKDILLNLNTKKEWLAYLNSIN